MQHHHQQDTLVLQMVGGTASDGDFDGDSHSLPGGEDNEEEGEEMSLRGTNNSHTTVSTVAPLRNQVDAENATACQLLQVSVTAAFLVARTGFLISSLPCC